MDERGWKRRNLWQFMRVGLICALGGEYFINVLVLRRLNAPLLVVLPAVYGLYVLLQWRALSISDGRAARTAAHPVRARLRGTVEYWFGFTLFGLIVIEWAWLGHSKDMWLVQLSMLSFWSLVAMMPAIFTDLDVPLEMRLRARRRILIFLAVLAVPAAALELAGFEGEKNSALYLAFIAFTIGLQWTCWRYVHWVAVGHRGKSRG